MTEEKMNPLRERMIEDMRIRGMSPKTQQAYIRAVRYFAEFIGRSPDTATPEELRAYQLHMTDSGVSTGVFKARIVSLRFFFGMTCGREEMKRYMQFRRKAKKRPVVLSVEEVGDLLAAVPGPGLKYRAALGISYGAGLRASEVCNLKVSDIDSDRMLIHVDEGKNDKDCKAMLSPALLDLLRDYWREARPEGWLFPIARQAHPKDAAERGQTEDHGFVTASVEPRIHLGQTYGRYQQTGHAAHVATQLYNASARGRNGCPGDPGASGSFQAQHDGPLYVCCDQDHPRHRQPVRDVGEAAGSYRQTGAGVTARAVASPTAGDCRHLSELWPRVPARQCRACQSRPTQGDVGD